MSLVITNLTERFLSSTVAFFPVLSETLKAERFQTKDGRKLIICLVEHLDNDLHKQRHTLYKTNT